MRLRMRRTPVYKQMSFETAIRNPERYKSILSALKDYTNETLSRDSFGVVSGRPGTRRRTVMNAGDGKTARFSGFAHQ